ncbi:terpenoid synthase [Auriscalpium vulgare]|uniref:Terpenoid synthase n=1 Tax=Auriscalpium vulgare TaxID=40419 RepID=A0ACB8SDI1_9AGAM|nr:terpenoid synthase [Auriscalpium vulgare]
MALSQFSTLAFNAFLSSSDVSPLSSPPTTPTTSTRTVSPTPTLVEPGSFLLPDLVSHCSFPLIYHPNGDAVANCSLDWMLSFVAHFTPRKMAASRGLLAGELTAFCYNNCSSERLRVVSDFMNFLFHLDNISDGMMARDAKGLSDWVMNAFEWPEGFRPLPGQKGDIEEISAAKLARDFWSRCIVDCPPAVQQRFKSSMNMFFQSVHQQASDRARGIIPDLESYIDIRRDTSGCKPVFDLIEYSHGFALPDEVVEHPTIMALNEGANDLVTWSNDIFSFNVEQARGDTHNMICIFMAHEGATLQEAVDRVGSLCKQTIDVFVENQRRLPSWGAEIDRMVDLYVFGLQEWIVGALHWSFQTRRYFGADGAEVKRTRVVSVLPLEKA